MSEATIDVRSGREDRVRGGSTFLLVASIARRNLGRNWRRTGLTAGGIGFAVALLAFAISSQIGSYAAMIDNATALMSSHIQIQANGYQEDARIEDTVSAAAALANTIRDTAGVSAVSERVLAFTLVSAGERSFAGQLVGVDVDNEPEVSNIPHMIVAGRYLDSAVAGEDGVVEAFAGAGVARNLGVNVGDEIVLLGTDSTGGVAALVTRLVGVFSTGQADVDRFLIEVPIDAVREAFALEDQAHAIVVRTQDVTTAPDIAALLRDVTNGNVVLEWQQLVPELQQAIDLDRVSGRFFYAILALIVTFSIVNTFVMLVFERTREFGMLLAIGMRPWAIVGMLQLEAFWLSLLGVVGGLAVAIPLIVWVASVGIPLGDAGAMMAAFHMPDRFYTAFAMEAIVPPSATMMAATLGAAAIGSLRVLRLRPVEALRAT